MKQFCIAKPTIIVITEITNGQDLFAVQMIAWALTLKLTQQENRPVKE